MLPKKKRQALRLPFLSTKKEDRRCVLSSSAWLLWPAVYAALPASCVGGCVASSASNVLSVGM